MTPPMSVGLATAPPGPNAAAPGIQAALSVPAATGRTGRVAEDFEALLLTHLLKGMRRTVPETGETNTARDLYHELHDEMLATHLARNGGIGLAAMIRAYLDRSPGPARNGDALDVGGRK